MTVIYLNDKSNSPRNYICFREVSSMNIDVLQPLVVRKFSILMNRSYPKKFGNFDIIADRPV